ncbi:TetR/AcrR family transcriptional regulator [Sporosarcina siberiensis]|uniref:TetR/AcrR family transcriptional regulator n=1 Tax=Sporosarcina siberiensis TaxID=1365606 RepID=A0ABW4SDR9_9BACL
MNDRKQHVLLVAKDSFLKKGFAATSVQDILDEAKISKGTFYNYFSTKNECLMAILDNGRDETTIRRQELMIGQSRADKKLFAEQISVRLMVNRDHNLLPIFEAVFYSGDADLKAFARKHHLAELAWLTNRLIEVYGDEAAPFAQECAILMMGMMQHMIHVWAVDSDEELSAIKLVEYILRRLDSIMSDIIKTSDHLLNERILRNIDTRHEEYTQTKTEIVQRLERFNEEIDKDVKACSTQYIQFILNELRLEHPRIFLLETILRSFRESFADTPDEREVHEITSSLWRYLETLK